jgi:hypothetical protein
MKKADREGRKEMVAESGVPVVVALIARIGKPSEAS